MLKLTSRFLHFPFPRSYIPVLTFCVGVSKIMLAFSSSACALNSDIDLVFIYSKVLYHNWKMQDYPGTAAQRMLNIRLNKSLLSRLLAHPLNDPLQLQWTRQIFEWGTTQWWLVFCAPAVALGRRSKGPTSFYPWTRLHRCAMSTKYQSLAS